MNWLTHWLSHYSIVTLGVHRAGVTAVAESYSGKSVAPPAVGHHFLHIDDFSTDEIRAMLDSAAKVKAKFRQRDESFKPFAGKTMAMIFTKPSMRTRISFETVCLCSLGRCILACVVLSLTFY